MSKIKCLVEECKHNSDYYCSADDVEICSCGTNSVNCCDQTACRTFKQKGCCK